MIKEITPEILDKIKELTGCVGIYMIITDSQLPCPDVRSGAKCTTPHQILVSIDNLSVAYILDITAERCQQIMNEFKSGS